MGKIYLRPISSLYLCIPRLLRCSVTRFDGATSILGIVRNAVMHKTDKRGSTWVKKHTGYIIR